MTKLRTAIIGATGIVRWETQVMHKSKAFVANQKPAVFVIPYP